MWIKGYDGEVHNMNYGYRLRIRTEKVVREGRSSTGATADYYRGEELIERKIEGFSIVMDSRADSNAIVLAPSLLFAQAEDKLEHITKGLQSGHTYLDLAKEPPTFAAPQSWNM